MNGLNVDQLLSNPVEVQPSEYVAAGLGSLRDVFHPQARFTSIRTLHRTLRGGQYDGEQVYAVLVEGCRPRLLGLGVRRFVLAITVNRKLIPAKLGVDREKIQALETYLARC
ncbi:MAG: hypothetical protein ACYDA8_05025 [Deferrisomatales bacterium]